MKIMHLGCCYAFPFKSPSSTLLLSELHPQFALRGGHQKVITTFTRALLHVGNVPLVTSCCHGISVRTWMGHQERPIQCMGLEETECDGSVQLAGLKKSYTGKDWP